MCLYKQPSCIKGAQQFPKLVTDFRPRNKWIASDPFHVISDITRRHELLTVCHNNQGLELR